MVYSKQHWTKRMVEELRGSFIQRGKKGLYYYRLQVSPGVRKEFPLKTSDYNEACQLASAIDAVRDAPNKDIALAQVQAYKGYTKQAAGLPLTEVWKKYSQHPDRAMPHTVSEQEAYQRTYREFFDFVTNPLPSCYKKRHTVISHIDEVTPGVCEEFSAYLKTTALAVDTHNRKIKRLRKIFSCLSEYYDSDNPFKAKSLLRNTREEQDTIVRRQAFTRDQEEDLKTVLADTTHKVMNKPEVRVIYYLGMYTGQRMKDCVLLQWQNVDMEHQRIWVKQFKTGKEVTIPIAPQLLEVLHEAYERKINQYVNPNSAARYNKKNEAGKNVGNNLVNIDILRVIRWIGLEPSVTVPGRDKKMTVYGFHSLRHSFCSFCAEAGVPKAVLLSILGTESDIADKYYTHVGDEAQIRAINAIAGNTEVKSSAQQRIDAALSVLKSGDSSGEDILKKIYKIFTGGTTK